MRTQFDPSTMLESLQPRCLFTYAINNGVLEITGTTSADNMYASWNSAGSASTVKVSDGSGITRTYPVAGGGFTSIYFYGGNGNDVIEARRIQSGFNHYTALLPVTINGGAGSDSLTGSDGADSINGGSSDDTIVGFGGDDFLVGDGGNDRIDGGDGSDTLFGGDGADELWAGRADSVPFNGPLAQADGDADVLVGNAYGAGNDGDSDSFFYSPSDGDILGEY